MAGTRVLQQSLIGGELSANLYGRVADAVFAHGAAKIRNFIVRPQGSARTRPGLRFVGEVKQDAWTVGSVDTGTEEIATAIPHTIQTGEPVTFALTSGSTMPTPLVDGTRYYAIRINASTVKVAATRADALAGTAIDLTGSGSGTIFINSCNKGRVALLPFAYSATQTLILQLGRAIVDSRSSGYIRFYTGGGTLQYSTPSDYVTSRALTGVTTPASEIDFGTAHGLSHGDPIVFTIDPASAVTFTSGTTTVNLVGHLFDAAQPVVFKTDGTLPPEIQAGTVYYVSNPIANAFKIVRDPDDPQANAIVFSSAGTGNHSCGAFFYTLNPRVQTGQTVYARVVDANKIKVCSTRANALAGVTLTILDVGSTASTMRMHRRYEVGDLVKWTGAGAGNFYCMKVPWDTHLDHAPTDTTYWYRLPADLTFEVPHNWMDTELFDLHYAQSADVLSLVHPNHPAQELRRLGATQWQLSRINFGATLPAPKTLRATATFGGTINISAITNANPGVGTTGGGGTTTDHGFLAGDSVYISGATFATTQAIPDDYYLVNTTPTTSTFTLRNKTTGIPVDTTGAGAYTADSGKIRLADLNSDTANTYVVAAVDANGVESDKSEEATVTNNLLAAGASNTLTWQSVAGAIRYRVYRQETGLFGLIGETDKTTFVDDNSNAADLDRTPPIADTSLLRSAAVTFDLSGDRVNWASHGLVAGSPVQFTTDGTLPAELLVNTTYFVLNPDTAGFQLASTIGGTPIGLSGSPAGTHTAFTGAFPAAVGYFEGRRVFAGSLLQPQDVWFTRSSTESDLRYSLPVKDDDRIYHRIPLRKLAAIRHVVPLSELLLLTNSAEVRVSPANSDVLTPSSFASRPQTHVGISNVQPELGSNTVVFCAARGGHVREIGFRYEVQGYVSGDLSLRTAHLFDNLEIVQQAQSKAPTPIMWFVSASGKLLGLTYVPEEQIGAWHQHETDGAFESIACVEEGTEDAVYVVVRRTIEGSDVRCVEMLAPQTFSTLPEAFQVDSGLSAAGPLAAGATLSLPHLRGKTVEVVADGVPQGSQVVDGDGHVTLPVDVVATVAAGLPLTPPQIDTLPLGIQIEAASHSRQKNIRKVSVRTVDSMAFSVGPLGGNVASSDPRGVQTDVQTRITEVVASPVWSDDGQVSIQVPDPVPVEVASIVIEVAIGG